MSSRSDAVAPPDMRDAYARCICRTQCETHMRDAYAKGNASWQCTYVRTGRTDKEGVTEGDRLTHRYAHEHGTESTRRWTE